MDNPRQLDKESVSLVLQHLAAKASEGKPIPVTTQEEAVDLVRALLAQGGHSTPEDILERASDPEVARRLLEHISNDPATSREARDLLETPPQPDQAAAETVMMSAAVLGALIVWLQTKIQIRVVHKDGKKEFEFSVAKGAASTEVIRQAVTAVSGLFRI